jgi:hypothetical protein
MSNLGTSGTNRVSRGHISRHGARRPERAEASLNHRGGVQDTRGQPRGARALCQERLEKNLARRACAEPNRREAGLDSGHVEHGRPIHLLPVYPAST